MSVKMNVRKVRRMCGVRGCRNTDCYAIARSTEFGGVIICKDCLQEALAAIGGKEPVPVPDESHQRCAIGEPSQEAGCDEAAAEVKAKPKSTGKNTARKRGGSGE